MSIKTLIQKDRGISGKREIIPPWEKWIHEEPEFHNNGNKNPVLKITENASKYNIYIAAPGFKEDDFKIEVCENSFLITANKKERKEGGNSQIDQEHASFSRRFKLPEDVLKNKIIFSYEDDFLAVLLPKRVDLTEFTVMKLL